MASSTEFIFVCKEFTQGSPIPINGF